VLARTGTNSTNGFYPDEPAMVGAGGVGLVNGELWSFSLAPGPVAQVASMQPDFTDIYSLAAGVTHTCMLRGDGTAWCWGTNQHGELGIGSHDPLGGPVPLTQVMLDPQYPPDQYVVRLAVGPAQTCIMLDSGKVLCAGQNDDGEFGTGDTTERDFASGTEFAQAESLAFGYAATCVVTTSGKLYCAGHPPGAAAFGTSPVPISPCF
jgi:alpha-tubulin suppressor-like RCC1 family protein